MRKLIRIQDLVIQGKGFNLIIVPYVLQKASTNTGQKFWKGLFNKDFSANILVHCLSGNLLCRMTHLLTFCSPTDPSFNSANWAPRRVLLVPKHAHKFAQTANKHQENKHQKWNSASITAQKWTRLQFQQNRRRGNPRPLRNQKQLWPLVQKM